jgi:signal transduction histidine kinase
MVQESVRNVVRHAEASRVSVSLDADDREIRACVEDDGKGLTAPEDPPIGGLANLRVRAAAAGRAVTFTPCAPGLRVSVRLPLAPGAASAATT